MLRTRYEEVRTSEREEDAEHKYVLPKKGSAVP